jgi:hypothetical protein
MSDTIVVDGKTYYEESYLQLANKNVRKAQEDFRKLDAIIDEEGVARSCINPFEDLRLAIRGLNEQIVKLTEQVSWKPITDEELPKVGDELLSAHKEDTASLTDRIFCGFQYESAEDFFNDGWAYFRPISAEKLK